jgi:hypothetical protein
MYLFKRRADMVQIVATTGGTITVPDNAINIVTGPYPGDPSPKSYIRGNFGPGAVDSNEDASHLVARLQVTLAKLTRPNGTPVWVKVAAITLLRYPLDTKIPSPPNLVQSVIMLGAFHQALQEDIATIRRIMSQDVPALLATSVALTGNLSKFTNEFLAPVKGGKASKRASKKVTKRARHPR